MFYEYEGTYTVFLTSVGDGGVAVAEEEITIVDFTDLVIGEYTYTAKVFSATGQQDSITGSVIIETYADQFRLNFDKGEEIMYTKLWRRSTSNNLEFDLEELVTPQAYATGAQLENGELYKVDGKFFPSINELSVTINVASYDGSESYTMLMSARKL